MTASTHLYEYFQPTNYQLYIDVNRANKTITGKTTVTGNATQTRIALHQKYLTIDQVKVADQPVNFEVDDDAELFWIDLPEAGTTSVTVDYSAKLTDTMMGIYPSYYTVNGEKKQLIGTQFETTSARQAFPGVDEPEAKATFDLAIKYDEVPGETTISNMPEVKVEDGVHYFDTTVKMSTYLVAFAFGDMQSKQTETKSGVKIGVFATKAHPAKSLDFALDIAKRSIEFYEDFYQTPYPLPHSWQLALPDFSAGAMENWGLVTYREAALLVDPDNTSLDVKKYVATVIAHELAHQWFGDLVTMKWWDDLWLNESFADMMEYVATDALQPDWKIWDLYQVAEVPLALQRDATDGVQSVHVEVENPAEIDSIFDGAIVYAKGSRMLVMARALVGDEALRKGLRQYFIDHQYNNARGKDLWDALGQASGLNVSEIMNTWLEQPGYPVVEASVVAGQLTLTQQQFFVGEGKDLGRIWQIPLNANYAAAPKIFKEQKVVVGDYEQLRAENGVPFRVNVGNDSHFIVKYSPELLSDIMETVTEQDDRTKLQLLQDFRLLAEAGQMSYADIVKVLPRFKAEESAMVVDTLYTLIANLRKFVVPESAEEDALKAYTKALSSAQFERLGLLPKETDTVDDQSVRVKIADAALYGRNEKALGAAKELFEAHEADLAKLPADVRLLVLSNQMENAGNQQLFDKLVNLYRNAADASYKAALRMSLTKANDEDLLQQLVDLFKDPDTIKPQDLRSLFAGVLSNHHGEQLAWDWFRNNWDWLVQTVGGDMSFTSYVTYISRIFRTRARLNEFKEFFEPKINMPGLTREIVMDTKVIENRVQLVEREKDAVNKAIAATNQQ